VWSKVCDWLNVPFTFPHNIFSILSYLLSSGNPKVVWMIWKLRNSILFDNGNGTVADLVEKVKVVSWKWWLARSKAANCLFYEWKVEPGLCMLR
jgi:hypothetical protein